MKNITAYGDDKRTSDPDISLTEPGNFFEKYIPPDRQLIMDQQQHRTIDKNHTEQTEYEDKEKTAPDPRHV